MAGRIKGITIEIGGETTGLQKALSKVNTQSTKLQKELKDVEKLLKFNPGNTEALAQKQKLLADQVENTTKKLDQLKQAESQVQAQFAKGDISEEQYRAFRREIEYTEGSLNGLKNQLENLQKEQDSVAKSTKQLERFFESTGTSVDDFSDALGTKLTNAINRGTANSRDLENALNKIGKAALGNNVDINKMKKALDSVDDGKSITNVRNDLNKLAKNADEAKGSVKELGGELTGLVAGLAGGAGAKGVIEKALDLSSLDTKIDISFNVPEESKKSVKEAIYSVVNYGLDAEEALEGVRRQWALNKKASDETNAAIVKGAGVITTAYAGVDFIELIQETNEVAAGLKISNQEALGLMDSLLGAGFPPEQVDTVAEYGQQMKDAGFSAKEIQSIFEQGIDTKTWNIDNLNDGVKEARIQMATFGLEVPKALGPLVEQAGMSQKKFQDWGKAVAEGGEKGSKAMSEMVTWLEGIEDKTLRNEIATKIFGTKWEDQGENMTAVFQGLGGAVDKTKENVDGLTESAAKLDQDPTVTMRESLNNLMIALTPVMEKIAEIVTKITEWAANNPTLVATITGIITVVGILMGLFVALSPIIAAIGVVAGALGVTFGAVAAPILIIIGIIGALIAIGVLLYKNWDTIKAKASEIFGSIRDTISNVWNTISSKTAAIWNNIVTSVSGKISSMKNTVSTKFGEIKQSMIDKIQAAKDKISGIVDKIKGFFTGMKLKIPKFDMPEMPHFKIIGKFSWKERTIPKIGVDWYDKGGVFYGPQVIGVGEKRPEFVGALDDLRAIVSDSMREVTGKGNVSTSSVTINNEGLLKGAIFHVREEADIHKISRQIAKENKLQARANGVIR